MYHEFYQEIIRSVKPKIPGFSKEKAERFIELTQTNGGYGWERYQAKSMLAELKHRDDFDMLEIARMAQLNFPDNPLCFLPIILIFLTVTVIILLVLL